LKHLRFHFIRIVLLTTVIALVTGCSDLRGSRKRRNAQGTGENSSAASAAPGPAGEGIPFAVVRPGIRTLHFRTLLSKLRAVTGVDPLSLSAILRDRRSALGDYGAASGGGADLSWNETKIKLWLEAMQEVCQAPAMKNAAVWPQAATALVSKAYGRQPGAIDSEVIDEIGANAAVTAGEKFEVFCLVTLTSAEFVTS
jgi:hypothetical protein